jgi:uncharacterized protein YggU (UPF0235/DUF167 family)
MILSIKVAPKAARTAISGWMGSVLKISVTAVPERGKANEAVIELLAATLKLPKSSISVLRGHGGAQKVVQVDGLADGEILRRLAHPNP